MCICIRICWYSSMRKYLDVCIIFYYICVSGCIYAYIHMYVCVYMPMIMDVSKCVCMPVCSIYSMAISVFMWLCGRACLYMIMPPFLYLHMSICVH